MADPNPFPVPEDEAARLKLLRGLEFTQTNQPESAWNDLVELAAHIANAPKAWIAMVAKETVRPVACWGCEIEEMPRAESPCAQTIMAEAPLIAPENFPGFYAGFPIRVNGHGVGTLAVEGTESLDLSETQIRHLQLLASQAAARLNLRHHVAALETENAELLIQELGVEMAEEKYRSIFENVQEGVFQTTEEGRFISANPMLAKIYGFGSPDDLMANLNDISGQLYLDPERRTEFVRRMNKHDFIHDFQSPVRRQDGELIWISENVRAVRNKAAELLYFEGTVVDITEQKNAEQALRASELLYHSLVEIIPQNILRKDSEGRFTFANQRFCKLNDRPFDEIIGKTDHDLFPKDQADKYRRDDLRVMEGDQTYATTEIHTQPDGTELHVEVIKTPLHNEAGEVTGLQCMFWDVTERHLMEEQLAYERDLLNALLDNVPDRIYIKDTESRFIKGSSALARRLSLESADEIIGKTDYNFHPENQAREFHEDEQRVILTGKAIVNKVEQQTSEEGRTIWASVTKVPFRNRSGIITGIIGISRDITALKLAEEESARARDLAVEAAQVKAQFLAVMSHEIRTPMNGIIGMIDLLLSSELSEDQREYAQTVRTSADALLDILNDILDLSKIEAGRLELEKAEFSLRKVLEEAVELHALRAEANQIELNANMPVECEGRYRGDAGRLRQVLLNLVSNAVKFTEQGEVQVSVIRKQETDGSIELQFSIRDTGLGITPEEQEKIFDAFRQADGSTNRRYGGTGLGLSISRQLTEMMGGHMWLESVHGEGSTFHFTVQLENFTPEPQPADDELIGKKILVVAPNDFARETIAQFANAWKMDLTTAATGEGARQRLNEQARFDLILVDLALDDEDGLDLVQEIQTHKTHREAKTILLTSRRQKVDPGLLRTLGVAGTLLKPMRRERLHQVLINALTGKTHTPKSVERGDAASHRSLRVLVAEDNPINQRVATLQLNKLGHEVDLREDGQGVLDTHLGDFDIILMDCQMPNVDGLEATRQIRQREQANPEQQPIYIIAMTANTQEDDRTACLKSGMDDFISKPVQLKELDRALNKSLGLEPGMELDVPSAALLDQTQLDQFRVNDNDDMLRELVSMYLSETDGQIDSLSTQQDPDTVARIAHQLKGSSANLGARQLADAFSRLEETAKAGDLAPAGDLLEEIRGTFDRTRVKFNALLDE
ncbi:MAG: PAS domain S-box protein [Verrucomicrobiia bacterium]